jgi:hypothetical protein
VDSEVMRYMPGRDPAGEILALKKKYHEYLKLRKITLW